MASRCRCGRAVRRQRSSCKPPPCPRADVRNFIESEDLCRAPPPARAAIMASKGIAAAVRHFASRQLLGTVPDTSALKTITRAAHNKTFDDQNAKCRKHRAGVVPRRCWRDLPSAESGDCERDCLLCTRSAGAEERCGCDPLWSDSGSRGACAHLQERGDDILPRLCGACWFLECACALTKVKYTIQGDKVI
jgi:hypothetical protein